MPLHWKSCCSYGPVDCTCQDYAIKVGINKGNMSISSVNQSHTRIVVQDLLDIPGISPLESVSLRDSPLYGAVQL